MTPARLVGTMDSNDLAEWFPRLKATGVPVPGLCECECGQPTGIATRTDRSSGRLNGRPMRFINGHSRRRDLFGRFWEKVDRSGGPTACWLWTGAKNPDGYGRIGVGRHAPYAHRVAWGLTICSVPAGFWVLHNCPGGDNPSCVNPAHLWLGGPPENTADMMAKGRHRPLRGEQNGMAKLTAAEIREIRHRAAVGESQVSIASRYGVSERAIYSILAGRTWAHVAA